MNNIKNRTLGNLWETLPGKIVIYLENDDVKEQFVADAAADGYTVNGAKPTKDNVGQIILLRQHSLSNLGFAARVEFQCNGGSHARGCYHRIDYKKYKNGSRDFYYDPNKPEPFITLTSKFHGIIKLNGYTNDDNVKARNFFKLRVDSLATAGEEKRLFKLLRENFAVDVIYDND